MKRPILDRSLFYPLNIIFSYDLKLERPSASLIF